ncbi:MAG TPA: hypothetical protein VH415_14595 [Nitrososphaeraceae archaeon]|jgi:hypothetical protein
MTNENYITKVLPNSVKFYLPRTEGYFDIVKEIASQYGSMSLIEFDGYFEGKFEPVKYTRVEVHTVTVDENDIVKYANTIRSKLKQESLALEFNNKLILVIKNERNS